MTAKVTLELDIPKDLHGFKSDRRWDTEGWESEDIENFSVAPAGMLKLRLSESGQLYCNYKAELFIPNAVLSSEMIYPFPLTGAFHIQQDDSYGIQFRYKIELQDGSLVKITPA